MSQTHPIKPESRTELENIAKVSEYSVKFGAEKEQIAREAVEKNGFDFLCAGRNPIGFVFYEFMKGEMMLQARREKEIDEEKKRKRTTTEEEEENKRVQQQQRNPSRPNMKIAILEVVKKHLQPFYENKDISKEEYKTICKKTCEKVMSKELQVRDEEESVKLWLDEHAKKKIRGLVETFVEKTRNAKD
jgi:hypothetical protein